MTIAFIQARLGSTRLPRKVLLELVPGKSMLAVMAERVAGSKLVDKIVFVIPTDEKDDPLAAHLEQIGQEYTRGSEDDVLDRYYQAAKKYNMKDDDIVIRLTSDCPIIDPVVIDEVIQFYKDGGYDYAANGLEPYTYPDGMDTEVFSYAMLEKAAQEATKQSHREHVTFYFWKNPDTFKVGEYVNKKEDQGGYRWTVDYQEDYDQLKHIYEHLYPQNPLFSMQEIVDHLEKHPEILALNAKVSRNASWAAA